MEDIKVIFFDLYKTLIFLSVDTKSYALFLSLCGIKKVKELAKAREIILTEDLISLAAVARRFGIKNAPELEKMTSILENKIPLAKMYDDVWETLTELSERGIKLCLISNLAMPYKRPVYDLGLASMFIKMFFSCERGCKKPDEKYFY